MIITLDRITHHLTAKQRKLLKTLIKEHPDASTDAIVQRLIGWIEDATDEEPNALALKALLRTRGDEVRKMLARGILDPDEPVIQAIQYALYEELALMSGVLKLSYGRAFLDSREVIDGHDRLDREGHYVTDEGHASALIALWDAVKRIIDEHTSETIDSPPSQTSFGDVSRDEYISIRAERYRIEDIYADVLEELGAAA